MRTLHSPENRWLCLQFPLLPLIAINQDKTNALDQPMLISHKGQLVCSNQAASEKGLDLSMTAQQAQLLCPEAIHAAQDLNAEEVKLTQLAQWAYQYNPNVCIYPDYCIVIELHSSVRLFGGISAMLNRIHRDLCAFKLDRIYALAHTAKGAFVLAKQQPLHYAMNDAFDKDIDFIQQASGMTSDDYLQQLRQLPLEILELEPKTLKQLQHSGIHTVYDLDNIPRADLSRRFKSSLLSYLDQLLGFKADPQRSIQAHQTFFEQCDFAEAINNRQWIQIEIEQLLRSLCEFLQRRQLHCSAIHWQLTNDKRCQTITLRFDHAHQQYQKFLELSLLKLEQQQKLGDLISISLKSESFQSAQLLSGDLFDSDSGSQDMQELTDRVRNQLGDMSIHQLQNHHSWIPESRQSICKKNSSTAQPSLAKFAPMYVLDTPRRLPEKNQRAQYNGVLHIINGPERIQSHWWQAEVKRDYFIARQENGRVIWIYHDLHKHAWYLHGFFA